MQKRFSEIKQQLIALNLSLLRCKTEDLGSHLNKALHTVCNLFTFDCVCICQLQTENSEPIKMFYGDTGLKKELSGLLKQIENASLDDKIAFSNVDIRDTHRIQVRNISFDFILIHYEIGNNSFALVLISKSLNTEKFVSDIPAYLLQSALLLLSAYNRHSEHILFTNKFQQLGIRENFLNQVLEQLPLSVLILDSDFKIRNSNRQAVQLSGIQGIDLKGMYFGRSLNCAYQDEVNDCTEQNYCKSCKLYRTLRESSVSGKSMSIEELKLKENKGGILSQRYYLFTSIPLSLDGEKVILCTFLDRTNIIQTNLELKRTRKKAIEASKVKAAILANISHELRTPLNSIIGFSELIKDSKTSREVHEFATLVNKGGEQLNQIVNDILQFSSLEQKNIQIKKDLFQIKTLFEEVHQVLNNELEYRSKHNIKTAFYIKTKNKNPQLFCDRSRLKHILTLLIKNAVKFTDTGRISFGCTKEGEKLRFYVSDTGIGIPKEKSKYVFDAFSQVDYSMSRKYGGTGIGLAIAKNIVTLLGGKIWFESDGKSGSTFFFELNCLVDEKSEEPVKKEKNGFSDFGGKKILVVEDNDSNFSFLSIILKKTNFDFLRARNGLEAVELFKNTKDIALILMDIEMPLLDGVEATKMIKAINPDIKIIVQTAYAMPYDRHRYRNAGCDDFIAKPYSITDMLAVIKRNIHKSV